jgi:hypothetical protein
MFDFTKKVNGGHQYQTLLDPMTGLVVGGHK